MTEPTAGVPIGDAKARPTGPGPLAAAQADAEASRVEIERLTQEINTLLRDGPNFDQAEHARLTTARDAAHKRWRHADLAVRGAGRQQYAPLFDRTVEKLRRQRRRVFDLHPGVLAFIFDVQRLRDHRKGLESAIVELECSPDYQHARREVLRNLSLDDDVREELSAGGRRLAKLELDLVRAKTEHEVAKTAQAQAQIIWESEKATLESWEEAIRAMGPAAQRALQAIPKPGASDDDPLVGYADLQVGPGQTPHDLHEKMKRSGRDEVFA